LNGVTIEVPSEKMSPEDMKYIARITGKDTGVRTDSIDSRPSMDTAIKLPSVNVAPPPPSARPRQENASPKKRVDWFEFFLNAGCGMDDCTRYAQAFERDKIDESILPDMKSDTLRALGLREGDIIRVIKAIEKRGWKSQSVNDEPTVREQIEADERYAQQVQEAILAGKKPPPAPGPIPQKKPTSPPPNLFATSGGALKDNTRRGRPNPGGRSAAVNVDENLLANATNQLGTPISATQSNRTPSPNLIHPNHQLSYILKMAEPKKYEGNEKIVISVDVGTTHSESIHEWSSRLIIEGSGRRRVICAPLSKLHPRGQNGE